MSNMACGNDPSLAWKNNGVFYNKGPDQILPSKALYTSNPEGATKISQLCGNGGEKYLRPLSVPSLLQRSANIAPDRVALAVKRNGDWVKWTYKKYLEDVLLAAKGFIALGLERHHSVCIIGSNSPEWYISDLAAIYAGGIAAGIYTTNSAEACAFIAKDSKANIFIVEDEDQLQKVLKFRTELPHLKAIIQYTGELNISTEPGVYSWSELINLGVHQSDNVIEERLKRIAINQPCTLIYTSGTTGPPKGCMLSHDNLTWLAFVNCKLGNFRDFAEEYISFLPLSHTAAQIAELFCGMTCFATIYFGDKNVLKGSLMDTVMEVQPTKFMAVTRVWEKIYEKMQDTERQASPLKKLILNWAKYHALEHNLNKMNGVKNPETIQFKIANYFILSKIKTALGLTRSNLQFSGAAPISSEILKYFMSLNILVTEVFGMSECSGPHAVAVESAFRLGSVGKTLPGALTKIKKPDEVGIGEICVTGRHIQMGYLNQPEKSAEILDKDGWLHSGDLGRIDNDGYIFITGRIKELLITAGGENVAPVPIEDNVKKFLPLISQAMLLGDKLKFISVLLTLKTEIDKETQTPLNILTPFTKDWIKKNGDCDCATVDEVLQELFMKKNKKLETAIQDGINKANEKAISRAQTIQKWRILPVDFSIPGGELGPTLKLKRTAVAEKYKHVIIELYNV